MEEEFYCLIAGWEIKRLTVLANFKFIAVFTYT